ncbi:MAG: TonB-dependent receptor [Bacteroidota bacterium]
MKKRNYLLLLLSLHFSIVFSQEITQTVRGKITDKISQQTLPGVSVVLLTTAQQLGVSTDMDGNFKIEKVPIGKHSFKISFIGYEEAVLQNISVNAGKELILNVSLEEDINQMKEVVITAKTDKNKALNDMSTVSTRTFSVEETQKFAAAINDPGRMATSFAGVVQSGDDSNNRISIRGNSPNGLLWRIEGVEIPNPNHFSDVGTSGGAVSLLSAQLLGNSDFSTGAFAAEYGNALSGVFDLKFRKGNNEKREYTFQAGFLGMDACTEGYFKKGYEGSYLINYRYSTLTMLSAIGVPIGDANTVFQDLSFNISLPTKKVGVFSIFGFGGLSSQTQTAKQDSLLWKTESYQQYSSKFESNTGAIGLTNTKLFSNQSYLRTALVFSGTKNAYGRSKLDTTYADVKEYAQNYLQNKITLSSVYTQKVNARINYRTGFIANVLNYDLSQKHSIDTTVLVERIKNRGTTQTLQAFYQVSYKIGARFTANAGVHYLQLLLNNSKSIEPRASLKYDVSEKSNVTLGYGLHSQLQPIGVYFARENLGDGTYNVPNKNLELSKAHHLVTGYDFSINDFSHIKTEIYFQHLFNIPISQNTNRTYSVLNEADGFTTEKLVNKGLGKNYGMELTYERFLHKNLYYLLSASVFESKFKAPNGQWYNTRYNTNYAGSFTIGKEWTLSEKRKHRVVGANIKSMYSGGVRYTPVNYAASVAAGQAIFDATATFGEKNPDYFRTDIRVSVKRNYKKLTSTLALDIQNVTNRKNVGGQYFDTKNLKVEYYYQTPLIPVLSYKVEF